MFGVKGGYSIFDLIYVSMPRNLYPSSAGFTDINCVMIWNLTSYPVVLYYYRVYCIIGLDYSIRVERQIKIYHIGIGGCSGWRGIISVNRTSILRPPQVTGTLTPHLLQI